MMTACWNGNEEPSPTCKCPYCEHWRDVEKMVEQSEPYKKQARKLAKQIAEMRGKDSPHA